jgi:hypothetical protein
MFFTDLLKNDLFVMSYAVLTGLSVAALVFPEIKFTVVQPLASTTWYMSRRGSMSLSGLSPRPLRSRPGLSVAQFHLF